jgi:hypothetical protein
MKYTIKFIYEVEREHEFNDGPNTPRKLEVTLPGDVTLPELIEQFEYFVKGIGYFPPENAHLDYVDNDTDIPKSNDQ